MHSRRLSWLHTVVLMTVAPLSLHAQSTAGWAEWETLSPEGEEFTVLMPKNPGIETAKIPYHKMELTSRLYLSSLPNGPVIAIASLNGIKSNPALYTDLQRFNSYVDAFKNWFPAKVSAKDQVAKLTLVGNHTFHGYDGREYSLTIGDLTGVLHTYATRKRFYAIVSLNTKKDDATSQKFLTSFVLPDKPADTRTAANLQQNRTEQSNVAIDGEEIEPAAAEGQARLKKRGTITTPPNSVEETPEQPNQAPSSATASANGGATTNPTQKKAPINGGMLNGKAIYLPIPDVPAGEATGVVLVQVLVDEQGSVVEARAVSGPRNLLASAVTAARLARFTPTLLMGEPTKVTGTLSYNFVRSN